MMSEDKRNKEMVEEQIDGKVKGSRRDFLKKMGVAAAATVAAPAAVISWCGCTTRAEPSLAAANRAP